MLEARMSYNQLEACLKEEKEILAWIRFWCRRVMRLWVFFLLGCLSIFKSQVLPLKEVVVEEQLLITMNMVELSMAVSHLLESFHGRFPLFCSVALFSIIQKLQNLQSPCHCPAMCWNGFVNQIIREKKSGTTKFGSCSPGNFGSRRWKVWEKGI